MDSKASTSGINNGKLNRANNIETELIYLIAKYLSAGPCKKSYEVLKSEIEENEILPSRTDWLGNEHKKSFNEYDSENSHIAQNLLLQIVSRLEPTIQQLWPTFPNKKNSLLGIGSQSLLRTEKDLSCTYKTISDVINKQKANCTDPVNLKGVPNLTQSLIGREISGSTKKRHFLTNKFYSRLELFVRNVGHLSAIYCMLFDRSGRFIITGADDMLVKIWSIIDGRLVATLRGASAEISDLAIDYENILLAAGSCDKIIRVWNLQTLAPIAVLTSHTGMITALQFCPAPDSQGVLVSTGGDGCVAFWTYTKMKTEIKFESKPLKLNERVRPGHAQLICASFSTGGKFLAVGGADHFVRVYRLGEPDGVEKLIETEIHTDRVDSIQWRHSGIGFVTGSRDGTALIWRFQCRQWKTTKLSMTETLPGVNLREEEAKKLQVTMVGWDRTDSLVITASSDHLLRVWDSQTGNLCRILKGHEDNAYVIEAHPSDNRLILTAGHDGLLFIWDVFAGTIVKRFKNSIEGQGHGALFDAKWSPDGLNISTTDSHGHILIFGFGDNELFKKIPPELFFHTDYRPLVRDVNHHVLDEQTQLAPHLMPPPFLVNIDGDPYPPEFQRLVPGRENCRTDQLIPNVVTNDNGEQEVLDLEAADVELPRLSNENPEVFQRFPYDGFELSSRLQSENSEIDRANARLNIDDMIERLALEQRERRVSHSGREDDPGPSTSGINQERRGSSSGPHPDHSYAAASSAHDPMSPRPGRVGSRREGDIEGVRQSTGNWQRDPHMKWKRQRYLPPLSSQPLKHSKSFRVSHGELENSLFEEEKRKGPDTPIMKGGEEEEGDHRAARRNRRRQKKVPVSSDMERPRRGTRRGRPPGPTRTQRTQLAFGRDFEDPENVIVSHDEEEEREEEEEEEDASTSSSSSSSSSVAKEALEEIESSSDDTDSTDYSDWTADVGGNGLEPPKRTAHKQKTNPVSVGRKSRRKKKTVIESEDDEREEEEEGEMEEDEEIERKKKKEEEGKKGKKRERRKREEREEREEADKRPSNFRRKKDARNLNMAESEGEGNNIDEIPPEYLPPSWLCETVPKKAPYFPQMGDEIMYFRQGHQLYVEAVISRNLYPIDKRSLPWFRKLNLRDQEYVKIIGMKYEVKPPRLCCLKLGILDPEWGLTGDSFTIKYHDMPDVLDFLVLKSTYDTAVNRSWQPGDRFRCIIDDAWWLGTVESQEPHLPEFPDSMFMCYRVLWDNGERERLSPWDMEPIDDQMEIPDLGGSVQVCPEEYKNLVYTPSPEEWAPPSFEAECQRMANGIGKIMQLAVAEPFLAPVDLNVYPNYAMIVEYPMDLTTIKSRLESHFYRRPNAAQFDVRYIATNAEKFNKKGSVIVKHARIVTDLALRLIKDPACRDPTVYYHEVQANYQSPSHSEDEARKRVKSDSEEDRLRRRTSGRAREGARARNDPSTCGQQQPKEVVDDRTWQQQCRDLLKSMFERQDSLPFRFPVDLDQYEDYNQVIDVPMDLSTIREELAAGGYASPQDFAKDIRLIFQNSKNYNTNNKSRIYSMTVRLEAFFEDQIKGIYARCKSKEEAATSSPQAGPSSGNRVDTPVRMNGWHKDDVSEDENTMDADDTLGGSVNDRGRRRSRRVAKLRRLRGDSEDDGFDSDSEDEEYSPVKKPTTQKNSTQLKRQSTPTKASINRVGGRGGGSDSYSSGERREKGGPVKRSTKVRNYAEHENDSDSEDGDTKRRVVMASSSKNERKRTRQLKEENEVSKMEDEDGSFSTNVNASQRRKAKPMNFKDESNSEGSSDSEEEESENSSDKAISSVRTNGATSSLTCKRRIESSEGEDSPIVNGVKEEDSDDSEEGGDEDGDEDDDDEVDEEEEEEEEEEEAEEEEKSNKKVVKKENFSSSFRSFRKKREESEVEFDEEELEEEESESEEDEEEVKGNRRKIGTRGRKKGSRPPPRKKALDGDDLYGDDDYVADFIDDDDVSSTDSDSDDSEGEGRGRKRKRTQRRLSSREREKKKELARKERAKKARERARAKAKEMKAKAKAREKAKKARQKARDTAKKMQEAARKKLAEEAMKAKMRPQKSIPTVITSSSPRSQVPVHPSPPYTYQSSPVATGVPRQRPSTVAIISPKQTTNIAAVNYQQSTLPTYQQQAPGASSISYQKQPITPSVTYQQPSVTSTLSYQPSTTATLSYQQSSGPSVPYQQPIGSSVVSYQQPTAPTVVYQQPPGSSTISYQQPSGTVVPYQQTSNTTVLSYQRNAAIKVVPYQQSTCATAIPYQQSSNGNVASYQQTTSVTAGSYQSPSSGATYAIVPQYSSTQNSVVVPTPASTSYTPIPYPVGLNPRTHTVKDILVEGQLIGRVISTVEETSANSSEEESIPNPSTSARGRRVESEEESEVVGKRGRVRKKVKYNEDSEEGEVSSVSSRGRVRKANTRMRDFI